MEAPGWRAPGPPLEAAGRIRCRVAPGVGSALRPGRPRRGRARRPGPPSAARSGTRVRREGKGAPRGGRGCSASRPPIRAFRPSPFLWPGRSRVVSLRSSGPPCPWPSAHPAPADCRNPAARASLDPHGPRHPPRPSDPAHAAPGGARGAVELRVGREGL